MKTNWKNIILIVLTVILVPATLLTVYEFTSLDDSEEELRTIYDQQLETILFSVNQYSQDIFTGWVKVVEDSYSKAKETKNMDLVVEAIRSNPVFDNINILDKDNGRVQYVITRNGVFYSEKKDQWMSNGEWLNWNLAVEFNRKKIQKLINYKSTGYSKLEPIDFYYPDSSEFYDPQMSFMAFIMGGNESEYELAIIQLNTKSVLQRILAPKIESLAQNQLVVSIINKRETRIVYSSNGDVDFMLDEMKDIWILPDYALGISQSGTSLEQVIAWRQQVNIIVVVFFDVCLVIALLLIIRYLRKEAALAQHKSDFVSNVSHELRTPISLVKMYTESLEMGRVKDEKKREEYYRVINNETDRLSRIVNKILTFSRMDAGRKKFNFVEEDLNKIILRIFETYSHQMQELGYNLTKTLSDRELLVRVDQDSAEEAITNLIDNAIKYDTERKVINVETGVREKHGYFKISDQGIGITKEEQKKIFEKFYRVSSGLVHNTKGSGLGLSLVKHIMEGHGGFVEVDSRLNHGSTFTIFFPLVDQEKTNV